MEGFQVFLSDQESANAYFRDKFKVEGVELESDNNALGYIIYKLKIYKDIFLENNKKFSCKKYQYNGDYNRVCNHALQHQPHGISSHLNFKIFLLFSA